MPKFTGTAGRINTSIHPHHPRASGATVNAFGQDSFIEQLRRMKCGQLSFGHAPHQPVVDTGVAMHQHVAEPDNAGQIRDMARQRGINAPEAQTMLRR